MDLKNLKIQLSLISDIVHKLDCLETLQNMNQ